MVEEEFVDKDVSLQIPNDIPAKEMIKIAEKLSKAKYLRLAKEGTCKYMYPPTSVAESHHKGGRKKMPITEPTVCGERCIGDFCHDHKETKRPGIILNKKMFADARKKMSIKRRRLFKTRDFKKETQVMFVGAMQKIASQDVELKMLKEKLHAQDKVLKGFAKRLDRLEKGKKIA
jgi:hypothetical protein